MKKYKVDVDCPNCANALVGQLSKIKGIKNCGINFTLKELSVEFEDGADENQVMKEAKDVAHDLGDDFEIYI